MFIKKFIWILILSLGLSGCITTNISDTTAASYKNFVVKKFLIIPPSDEFAHIFTSELKSKDVDVEAVAYSHLFVAGSKLTKEKMLAKMKAYNIDAILAITINGNNLESPVQAHVSTLGDADSSFSIAYGDGVDETTPVMKYSRDTQSSAELIDPVTGERVWTAKLSTAANGIFSVQNDDTMYSISQQIIEALLDKGHFVEQE